MQPLCERRHPALGGGVADASGCADKRRDGRNVDDAAEVPWDHVAKGGMAQPQSRHDMQPVHFLLRLKLCLPEAAFRSETRVVNQQRQPAVRFDTFRDARKILLFRQVGLHYLYLRAIGSREFPLQLFQTIVAPGNQKKIMLRSQTPGERSPNSARRASDGN